MKPRFPPIRAARIRTLVGVGLFGLLAASCAALPESPTAGADPSDPSVRTSSATYRPVLSGYASQRPVAPAPWREQNDRAAPGRK